MKTVESGALAQLLKRLASGRTVTKAGIDAAQQMEQRKRQFLEQRKKIEESIDSGARLTKHRITL